MIVVPFRGFRVQIDIVGVVLALLLAGGCATSRAVRADPDRSPATKAE